MSPGVQVVAGVLLGALGGAALVFRRSLWVLYSKRREQPRWMYFFSCLAVPMIWVVGGISAAVAVRFRMWRIHVASDTWCCRG
jgi:hypothetical protein